MKFNKIIFILMIAATIIFAGMIGSSYAYYTLTDTSIDITTGNVTNGFSIVFSDNNYVNVKTGVPLNDDQVIESAKANIFSIIPNASALNGYDAYVNVSLINVRIDDALKVSDFKYSLICNDSNSYESTIGSGDGTSLSTGTDVLLGSLNTINGSLNINTNYQCYFRVWIANKADTSQNELMNKSFSALLKVNTIMRKQ